MSGSPSTAGVSTALLTDRYELTMVAAALADGTATRQCVFELFARRLPDGRRYGVVAGTGRLLESINRFRFGDQELAALGGVVDRGTLDWLADYRFGGDVDGYPEGELYFPGSPILTVRGTFADVYLGAPLDGGDGYNGQHTGDALECGDDVRAVHTAVQAPPSHRERVAQNLLGGGHHRRRGLAGREEQAAGHRHGDGAKGVDPQRAPGVAGAVECGLQGIDPPRRDRPC